MKIERVYFWSLTIIGFTFGYFQKGPLRLGWEALKSFRFFIHCESTIRVKNIDSRVDILHPQFFRSIPEYRRERRHTKWANEQRVFFFCHAQIAVTLGGEFWQ